MSDSPKDIVAGAYETWYALDPSIRGAILHDMVEKSRESVAHAVAFEAAGPGIKDVWAQALRRREFAKAYEAAFVMLASAGDQKVVLRHEPIPEET